MLPVHPWVVASLAAATLVSAVVALLGIGRSAERRNRRLQRQRRAMLRRAFHAHARDGGASRVVRRLARTADAGAFWAALESLEFELRGAAWRRLSDTLASCRHLREERWTLEVDSPWRRELAARRVSMVRSARSRRSLRRALERGPEPVAYVAAMGLARQRDAWALHWILDHPYYFATRPSRARTALLRAFGAGATAVLAQRLLGGIGDPRLERAAIERLGAAAHAPAAAAIGVRLTSPHLELRVAAARALGRIGSNAHSQALVAALGDTAWEVRAQAAQALGRLGESDAVPQLAASLTDPSWWVRRHSAYALADLGIEGTAALGAEAIASPDPHAREIAREALERAERRSA